MVIFFDENIPVQLAHAFNILQKGLNKKNSYDFEVRAIIDEFGRGVSDEEWIPEVGKLVDSIAVTQDFRIQTTRHQRDLILKHGLGIFFVSPPSPRFFLLGNGAGIY